MPTNEVAKGLHDKVTRGIALSEDEQTQLDAWYAEQDKLEREVLGPPHSSQRLVTLQTQVETTLTQLQTVTQRIQELTAQNDAVRREIAVLQRQLAHTPTP
jgi:septal ring factor EnvC (AmiA/AmiB activator)